MAYRECTIQDFRDIVAEVSNIPGIKKRYFNLITDVNGDPSIMNAYGLEIYDGKKWVKSPRENSICEVIDLLKESMDIAPEMKEKK